MSLLDSIDAFVTDTVTVTRAASGAYVHGIWTPTTPTSFSIDVCIQPATGMQRVVGGKDMLFHEDGEQTRDVRQMFTRTEVFPRTSTNDPDLITYAGGTWTVFRVELWEYSGENFYRAVITRETLGAS